MSKIWPNPRFTAGNCWELLFLAFPVKKIRPLLGIAGSYFTSVSKGFWSTEVADRAYRSLGSSAR